MLRVVQDEYLFVINVIEARSLHSETIYLVQTTFSKKKINVKNKEKKPVNNKFVNNYPVKDTNLMYISHVECL